MGSWRRWAVPALGGLLGGVFFIWIAGWRVINPSEIAWTMQMDWRIHFLGWHFFRSEPWHWPPGVVTGYYHAPGGTAIGFTDSIPLAAFLLKSFSSVLPMPFQYLGGWLLVCFALQGVFGVLLTRIWTSRPSLQIAGAALFVLMPTLLIRVGHPSLCSHWLLLWALWLHLKNQPAERASIGSQGALGLCAGLVHPYLAVMVLGILAARAWAERRIYGIAASAVTVVLGWWMSGLFTVKGTENLVSEGLGNYSMNLLSVITPSGWSTTLPAVPIAAYGQTFEGFHYLGVGVLALMVMALSLVLRQVRSLPWRLLTPLLVICTWYAIYALSPRITFAGSVLLDARNPWLERWAVFRASGRFFWPMGYLMLVSAIAITVTRLRPRSAALVLITVVALQFVDFRTAHAERRATSRGEAFHAWQNPLGSAAWHQALPHYDHMVLVPPRQCGSAPVGFEGPAFLAGLHGLTIDSAEVARFDDVRRQHYCSELSAALNAGHLDERTIYLTDATIASYLKRVAREPIVCGPIDVVQVCVTARSYQAWRTAADLR